MTVKYKNNWLSCDGFKAINTTHLLFPEKYNFCEKARTKDSKYIRVIMFTFISGETTFWRTEELTDKIYDIIVNALQQIEDEEINRTNS